MVATRDHPLEQARALAREAVNAGRGSDPDRAVESCDHALGLLLPVGPSDALADVLRWKGTVLRDRGSHGAASDLYSQSLAVAESIGYAPGRAQALNCLGTIAQLRGDLIAAERWYGEAARLAHRMGDRLLSGMVQQNLGVLAEMQGRTDEALAHLRLALNAFEQENQRGAVVWVLNNIGMLYTREGSYSRAGDALDRSLEMARAAGDHAAEGIIQENRAALFLATGKLEAADASASRAYELADQRHDNTRRAAALRQLARVSRVQGHAPTEAIAMLERALSLCELGEDAELRAEILSDLGDACRDAADVNRSKECWRRALDVARIAGFSSMVIGLQARLRPGSAERERRRHRSRAMTETMTKPKRASLSSDLGFQNIVGHSAAISEALELARRVANSPKTTVLLLGETGTGKELFARGIHYGGRNSEQPFVAVNCAAIPETLLESELFGHEQGAFTDARKRKSGLFELAGTGTLFLDEIHQMPISLQPKLLRVLESRRVRLLGGSEEVEIRCRLIAAANPLLEQAVTSGAFREDLFYRLNVFSISLPPLRERQDDIVLIARQCLAESVSEHGRVKVLSPASIETLLSHRWPGNVRELRNVIERAALLSGDERTIRPEHLLIQRRSATTPTDSMGEIRIPRTGKTLAAVEREAIEIALRITGGNRSAAARMLGISRPRLARKIRNGKEPHDSGGETPDTEVA